MRLPVMFLTIATVFAFAACGGSTATPSPTASPSPEPTASPTPAPTLAPARTPTPVPAPPTPASPLASDLVNGTLNVSLPAGDPGKVSILAIGPLDRSGSVPVIARNNTSGSVRQVQLSGTVRGPDGALLASGKDQGLKPNVVGPGQVVFGYVYFSINLQAPQGSIYSINATWTAGSSDEYRKDVKVTELNQLSDRIVGSVANPYNYTVSGPISVDVMCFDNNGQPLSTHGGFTAQDSLGPNATGSFQISLYNESCPLFLIAAGGYKF